ncbi:hypothetical protein [Lacunimicrobium album]
MIKRLIQILSDEDYLDLASLYLSLISLLASLRVAYGLWVDSTKDLATRANWALADLVLISIGSFVSLLLAFAAYFAAKRRSAERQRTQKLLQDQLLSGKEERLKQLKQFLRCFLGTIQASRNKNRNWKCVLRACVHVRFSHSEYSQLTDYEGGSGGPVGRRFPINEGIVGDAFTYEFRETFISKYDYKVDGSREYWLQDVMHFSKSRLNRVNPHTKSFLAMPIVVKLAKSGEETVFGAIFADSTCLATFGDAFGAVDARENSQQTHPLAATLLCFQNEFQILFQKMLDSGDFNFTEILTEIGG